MIDAEGVFLQGHFENDKEKHVKVKDCFGEWYPGVITLHVVPPYGPEQGVYCFFKTFAKHVKNMMNKQSKVN